MLGTEVKVIPVFYLGFHGSINGPIFIEEILRKDAHKVSAY